MFNMKTTENQHRWTHFRHEWLLFHMTQQWLNFLKVTSQKVAFCFHFAGEYSLHPVPFVLCVSWYCLCFTDWETTSDDSVREWSEQMWVVSDCFANNSLKRKNWPKIIINESVIQNLGHAWSLIISWKTFLRSVWELMVHTAEQLQMPLVFSAT